MGKRVQGTLNKLATQLISDMTKEIVAKNRVASGNLKNSFQIDTSDNKIGVFNTAEYDTVVDKGRRPGKFAPIAPLVQWASIKGIVPRNNRSLRQFAFAVSDKLMKKGYPGIDYVAKSFMNKQDIITKELGDAYLLDAEEQLENQNPNLK
tara:strand:+ start:3914 stop:4363 length:450 start_codon:yes stop_codon:yes gene_type:complete